VSNQNGQYKFDATSLPEILEWFRLNGGAAVFSHIAIIAGRFVNRMISYVSSSYKWHLTSLYLAVKQKGPRAGCDDLLQMMRLCGIYLYDNIPLTLVTHEITWKELNQAYDLQHYLLEQAESHQESLSITSYIHQISVKESLVPRRKLVRDIECTLMIEFEIDTDWDAGEIYKMCPEKMTGKVQKALYKAYVEQIKEAKSKWVVRSQLIEKILSAVENGAKKYPEAKTQHQINGAFKFSEKNSHPCDETEKGLLIKICGDLCYLRYNS
jgi:hypothetical protein